MRSLRELLEQLPTNPETGLEPAAVAQSVQRFGVNRLTALPRQPLWSKFLDKFDEPIIRILLGAALLSMIVELFQASQALGASSLGLVAVAVLAALVLGGARWMPAILLGSALVLLALGLANHHVPVEGLAVMIAVFLATGVAFASEYKSDREFETLNAQIDRVLAKVVRGGVFRTIPMEEVVVGDLVLLETGAEVPADGWVVKAAELLLDQSLMTGESEPVAKEVAATDDSAGGPDNASYLYRGTQVVGGIGQMLVAEAGDATVLGQIARRLSDEPDADQARVQRKLTISKQWTPLQHKLAKLAAQISTVGYAAAALIFLAQLLHGILAGKVYWPGSGDQAIAVLGVLLGYFVSMVIIIVVAVPEGLPMSVTVSLALAMRKMTRANALVRQLAACETIGSATVICTDKTGTLTRNQMQVRRLCVGGQTIERGDPAWPHWDVQLSWPRAGQPMDWIALNAAVNSTANLENKQGRLVPAGSSTEGALLRWLHDSGLAYQPLRLALPPVYQVHFSSDRKRMTSAVGSGDGLVVLTKGSPEWLVAHTTHYLATDGSMPPWTPAARQAVEQQLQRAAAEAMRTLAFGFARLPEAQAAEAESLRAMGESLESGLVFAGFAAIHDPLRDDAREAMAHCRAAGIEVKMVTGDNLVTARAIASQLGLAEGDGDSSVVMTSDQFNALTDDQLKERLPKLRVLARALPLDKFRLVRLLQDLGEVVAVTGDGTNDAPALKKADVGLAMGLAGTAVAKEASKIVLLDDSFATIVKAVQWGRSLYENIQRFVQFQLTINVSALTIYLLGTLLFQVEAPFTVLQLLWINVIMDTLASIALCSEPPRPGVMHVPPKKRDESILTPAMIRTTFLTAAFFVVVMLTLLVGMKGDPRSPGWFGSAAGPWSVQVGGARLAVAGDDLEYQDGWKIVAHPSDAALNDVAGHPAEVAFTVLEASLFFSVYVFFQVWNQINCRSLTPEIGGLNRLWGNPTFLAIASIVAIGQIIIVTFGGTIFKVQPLSSLYWLGIIAGTASVLVFGEALRRLRLAGIRGRHHEREAGGTTHGG
jgi:Ca2+-transporting ATPase